MRQPIDHATGSPIDHAVFDAAQSASLRRPVVFAELWRAGADTGVRVPLTGLSMTWNRHQLHPVSGQAAWVPEGDARLIPGAPGSLVLQGSTELRVWAGQMIGGVKAVCSLGWFGVVEFEVSGPAPTVTVTLANRSVAVSRARLEVPLQLAGGFQFLSDAFGQLLGQRFALEWATDDSAVAPLRLLETRTDPWEAIQQICSERGLVAWFTGDGRCRVQDEPALSTATPQFWFAAGERLIEASLVGSLEGFANRTLVSSNLPALTAPVTAVSTLTDPANPWRYGGEVGEIPQWHEMPAETSAIAQAAADTIQKAERPAEQVVFSAVLDARIELVDCVEVADPGKFIDDRLFLDEVAFDFAAGRMRCVSRADDQVETL